MTTITLTATQLRDLVTPVLPHASKDVTLPILTALRIRTTGQYVTAIATDRYRIGFQRIALDPAPEAGFDATVYVGALKQILGIFRPTRAHNPTLSLTVEGEKLTVAAADTLDSAFGARGGFVGASLTFQLVNGDYPKLDRLVRDALEGEPEQAAMAATFNPEFLADFRIGQPRHQPMRISPTGAATRPWLIRIGDDFLGLLVPVRFADAASTPGDPASWLALLDAPTEAEKPAAA